MSWIRLRDYDDGGLATDPPAEAPRATDSIADIDARLLALAEHTARLTATVKGRARAACCPRCGYYFTVEREEEAEPPPEPPRATQGRSADERGGWGGMWSSKVTEEQDR